MIVLERPGTYPPDNEVAEFQCMRDLPQPCAHGDVGDVGNMGRGAGTLPTHPEISDLLSLSIFLV